MFTVTVTEIQTPLTDLLNLVETGKEVIITRFGQPVARLTAVKKTSSLTKTKPFPFKELAAFRAKQPWSPTSSLEHLQALRKEARY